MLTRVLIGCGLTELWCYMHEAYDIMPFIIGGVIICTIVDYCIGGWK